MARRKGWQRWGFREERWREKPARRWNLYERASRMEEREEVAVIKRDRLAIMRRREQMQVERIKAQRRLEQEHREYINKYKGLIL